MRWYLTENQILLQEVDQKMEQVFAIWQKCDASQLPPVIETGTLGCLAIAAIPRSTTELKKLIVAICCEMINIELGFNATIVD